MKRQYGLDQIQRDTSSVITVGTFDGVHAGHRAIIRYLVKRARDRDGTSVVLSFSPHPREVVHGEKVPLLTTVDERAEIMEGLGIDRFIVIPFTEEFSKLPAEDFVTEILVRRIGVHEIVIGYDHAFGRDRRGDADLLRELGRIHGFTVDIIPAQVVEEHVVSSTEIREALTERGDVRLAGELLGQYYSLSGKVMKGDGRGRQIGFPTANLAVDHPQKIVPAVGVYAVRVHVLESGTRSSGAQAYDGMMNIGRRPTFGSGDVVLEVHLLDFEGDLYGKDLRVEFVERMRDERTFQSVDGLIEQLSEDRARCMQLLGTVG
jgi:riboflavin kinase/FMN adenylyltransferase